MIEANAGLDHGGGGMFNDWCSVLSAQCSVFGVRCSGGAGWALLSILRLRETLLRPRESGVALLEILLRGLETIFRPLEIVLRLPGAVAGALAMGLLFLEIHLPFLRAPLQGRESRLQELEIHLQLPGIRLLCLEIALQCAENEHFIRESAPGSHPGSAAVPERPFNNAAGHFPPGTGLGQSGRS